MLEKYEVHVKIKCYLLYIVDHHNYINDYLTPILDLQKNNAKLVAHKKSQFIFSLIVYLLLLLLAELF